MPAFEIELPLVSGGAFPTGSVIDHWIITYVSGPTSLPSVQIPGGQQYVQYTNPATLPGSYVVQTQAYDKNSNPLGVSQQVSFTLNPTVPNPPLFVPVRATLVGSAGAGTFILQFDSANLGTFTPGTVYDHCVVTLTGPTAATQNITPGQQKATFSGMTIGTYSYTLQAQDPSNNNLGPAMNGRFYWTEPQQTTQGLLIPKAVDRAVAVITGNFPVGGPDVP